MSSSLLVVLASLLFATMGVCIKYASALYGSGEIVLYRGAVGALLLWALARARGVSLKTRLPWQHGLRSTTGVVALGLWFHAIAALPLATAMTLNYTSSLWLALFVATGALLMRQGVPSARLLSATVVGFLGIVLVLRPTLQQDQWLYGLIGLLSGMVSALGYLQVASLGRAGEPEIRIVFYFCIGGIVGGAALAALSGWHAHTPAGLALLLAIGLLATVAQLLLTRAYAQGRTLVNASLQYLGIAFSFLYGVLLFGDAFTAVELVGMLLIVAACAQATFARPRPVQPAAERAAAPDLHRSS